MNSATPPTPSNTATTKKDGAVIINTAAAARRVLGSPAYHPIDFPGHLELIQRESGKDLSRLIEIARSSLVFQAGDQHRLARRLMHHFFSAEGIAVWGPMIAEQAGLCLDRLQTIPEPDLLRDFADPLFVATAPRVLGVDVGDGQRFLKQVTQARHLVEPMLSLRTIMEVQEQFSALLETVERAFDAPPRGEPRSFLAQVAPQAGAAFSRRQLAIMLASLLVAAHTTSETLAFILWRLLRAPAADRSAARDPAWVAAHLETWIRLYPSTLHIGRTAARKGTIDGCPVHTGDPIWIHVPSVNRDAGAFPPVVEDGPIEGVDGPNTHLSFGTGVHKCPGADLARLTIGIAIPLLMARFPGLTLREEAVQWIQSAMIKTPTALPCRLSPDADDTRAGREP